MDYLKEAHFVVLAIVAAALAGCGSSSHSPSPPPPLPPPASLDFVSQSVYYTAIESFLLNGTGKLPDDASGSLDIFLDADKVNLRLDTLQSTNATGASANASASAIVNVADKRVTAFFHAGVGNHSMRNCTYIEIAQMPPADTIKALIKTELKAQTATRDSKTGFNKIEKTFDPSIVSPQAKGSVDITLEMDDKSVLRKASVTGSVSKPLSVKFSGGIDAQHFSTTTAPDPSKFTVPKEWGTCKKTPILSFDNPALEHFEILLNAIVQHITMLASKSQSESLITI